MAAADKWVYLYQNSWLIPGTMRSARWQRHFTSSRGNRRLGSSQARCVSATSLLKVDYTLHREKLTIGTLFIDVDSARNLELVKNNITHKTSNTLYGERLISPD